MRSVSSFHIEVFLVILICFKAINNLQSTVNGFGLVNRDNVTKVRYSQINIR